LLLIIAGEGVDQIAVLAEINIGDLGLAAEPLGKCLDGDPTIS